MAARYYTLVVTELVTQIMSGAATLPDCLHPIRVVEAPTPPDTELIEFQDDDAPANLDGQRVTPIVSAEWHPTSGRIERLWISSRTIDDQ